MSIDFEAMNIESAAAQTAAVARLEPQSEAAEKLIRALVTREVFFAHGASRATPDTWRYRSVEQFVLGEGVVFDASQVRFDPDVTGKPKNCFEDALLTALRNRWSYAEGFAVGSVGIEVHHAWCIDDDDNVVDPTWQAVAALCDDRTFPHAHAAYVGVVLNPDVAASWVNDRGVYGLFYGPGTEALLEHGIDGIPEPEWSR